MNERISLMDRFQMNRSGCRPYQYTCGMNGGMAAGTIVHLQIWQITVTRTGTIATA